MSDRKTNVLFLCTHNSCRSVIAECILARLGKGKFQSFSAGSHPAGTINALALEGLARLNYDISGLRSKSWDEFAQPGAPQIDFIFTVCDNAANEVCPLWPGQPISAHWGVADPSRVTGSVTDKQRAFEATHRILSHRISCFVSLPFETLEKFALQSRIDDIGSAQHNSPPDAA